MSKQLRWTVSLGLGLVLVVSGGLAARWLARRPLAVPDGAQVGSGGTQAAPRVRVRPAAGQPAVTVRAGRYQPELTVRIHGENDAIDEGDASAVVSGLWSTVGRNHQRYLHLLDADRQAQVKAADAECGGQLLGQRHEPATEVATTFSRWYQVWHHGRFYQVMVGGQTIEGHHFDGLVMVLAWAGDRWVQSGGLDESNLLVHLGTRTLDEVVAGRS